MKEKVNAIFMSDLHLGTKACNSDLILDVLTHYDSQYIILNGDVIDFWQLRFNKSWTIKHNNILKLLF